MPPKVRRSVAGTERAHRAPRGGRATAGGRTGVRSEPLLLIATAAIAAVAILVHVEFWRGAGGLWRDEVSTVNLARLAPGASFWGSLRFDSFPAFALLALRGWMTLGLGGSDLALRGFGLLVGLLGILAAGLAARAVGVRAPALSMALFAVHPTLLLYADAIRPHGLGAVLALVALATFARAIASPSIRAWGFAAIASVLAVQTVFPNVFVVAGLAIGASVSGRLAKDRSRVIAPLVVLGVAIASLLPYLPAIRFAADLAPVMRPPGAAVGLGAAVLKAVGRGAPGLTAVWLATAGLGVASLVWSARRGGTLAWLAIAVVVASVGLGAFVARSELSARSWYFLPLFGMIAVAAEAGLSAAHGRLARVPFLRLGLAVLVLAVTLGPAREIASVRQTDVDRVARLLAEHAAEGDLVVVTPWYYGITFARYAPRGITWTSLPPIRDLSLTRWDLVKARMLEPDPVGEVSKRALAALDAGRRVWIAGALPTYFAGSPRVQLGPAPDPVSGWSNDPYVDGWALQFVHDLRESGARATARPVGDERVIERAALFEVRKRDVPPDR